MPIERKPIEVTYKDGTTKTWKSKATFAHEFDLDIYRINSYTIEVANRMLESGITSIKEI